MKIHTSKKSKEKQTSAKKISAKVCSCFLILYCIAVLTGKGKFNVQFAAGDLNSEVEHIGGGRTVQTCKNIGKNIIITLRFVV